MNKPDTHSFLISKSFTAQSETILNLFRTNVVFKLTGADSIQNDFETGRKFRLLFNSRGVIYGRYIKITSNHIIIEWNVEGFSRPDEFITLVEISLDEASGICSLNLLHKNIVLEVSAADKKRAWNDILDNLENHLKQND